MHDFVMANDSNRPEWPRSEPEIIPPDRARRDGGWPPDPWRTHGRTYGSTAGGGGPIFIGRIGPLTIAIVFLLLGIVVAVLVLVTIGAILFWIPVIALLLAAGAVVRFMRR
jgi:hypothetical protein